ncbi:hypothetical protein N9Z83_02955, partial [Akkermansiaceae bacterium]|nr:hypothetical protein [Akkermansiaceae bacterium]
MKSDLTMKSTFSLITLGLICHLSLVGLSPAQLAMIRQGDESVGESEVGDQFGGTVVLGNFNGDGFKDLATGNHTEKKGASDHFSGFVTINWGTSQGLTWEGATGLSILDGGLSETEVAGMGKSLAVGDFDKNGCDDLAVGCPRVTVNGKSFAGAVLIYYGNEGGLSPSADRIDQGDFSAAVESNDLFGLCLATGRFGGGAYDDLVIGSPGEDENRGAVFVVRGGAFGLNNSQKDILMGDDLGLESAAGDRFGSAIAVGNITGSIYEELIVGAPNAKALGTLANWGNIYVVPGIVSGLSSNEEDINVYSAQASGEAFAEDVRFGSSFAIGDFWGDGEPFDLAVGAPGSNVRGRVYIGQGGNGNLSWGAPLTQINSFDEVGDDFGQALAAGDHDDDGIDDLVVGSPGESFQGNAQYAAGSVHLYLGSNGGLVDGRRILSSNLDGGSLATKWFGRSVAMGRTSQSQRESIVVGAPLASGGGEVYDIASWRQLDRPSCNSALAVDCEGDIIYALRPFEQVRVASTTKIMTLLLGCEATQRPQNDPLRVGLNESYAIESWMYQAFPSTSNSTMYLFTPLPANQPAELYTFNELLRILFPPSGNDVAYAIADKMFGDIGQWDGFENTGLGFVG